MLALLTILLSLVVNYLRGEMSPLTIKKCSSFDWTIFALFVCSMLLMSYIGVRTNQYEQSLKEKWNKGLV